MFNLAVKPGVKHGMCYTPTYNSWFSMKRRCSGKIAEKNARYRDRGITVCERWHSFIHFFEDMGLRPPGTTLERVDNNKGYDPGNCKWATPKEQQNNTRLNRRVTFAGKTQNVSQWAEELGIGVQVLFRRLNRGWTIERALTQPVEAWKGVRKCSI